MNVGVSSESFPFARCAGAYRLIPLTAPATRAAVVGGQIAAAAAAAAAQWWGEEGHSSSAKAFIVHCAKIRLVYFTATYTQPSLQLSYTLRG